MKMSLLKSAVVAALMAIGTAQAANTLLSGGDIVANINDAGTFAIVNDGAPLGTAGLSYKGVEFINIDVTSAWYYLSAGGTDYVAQYGSNPLGATTTGGPIVSTTSNLPSGLGIVSTYAIVSDNQLSVQVTLTNSTASALTGVTWGVGFDPDQGGSGDNTTFNQILGQGASASVSAFDDLMRVTLANTTSAAAFDIAAFIGSDCCTAVSPVSALGAGQAVGFSTLDDDSISLAYNIGTIGANSSVTIGYSYTFAGPVPEPEIYAMMAAGLGLMGFVARRRQRNGAVA